MPLSLRQLRYFEHIARIGVIGHAAQDLGVAQSALSHHMAELEAQLGVRLFNRRPRGVALTPAGERLHEHAQVILAALERAEADVRDFTEQAVGPFVLGLCHTATEVAALTIMQKAAERLPGIHLTIVESVSGNLLAMMLRGEVDLAVAYQPPEDSRFNALPILNEHLYLVGLPQMIGSQDAPISFDDLPQGKVLALNLVRSSRSIVHSQFLRRQITPHPQLEIESLSALIQAMRAGLGCSILARATVAEDLAKGSLHARRIKDPELTRTLYLVVPANRPRRRVDDEMRKLISTTLVDAVAAGRWPGERLMSSA
ncbi:MULTISPECIES: LysR family transcriptional regulator [unclassified Paracoccus (in: a-proteobacteria)]|uniref:LysR family transcriptional regulator n=2 Tax=Paracoccus TaxID=265 RepID=UPI00048CAE57|nr:MULTISPECIES: LysR family transcriptional regulator [unclassified Paracoccus (in: a-proteobacteria)]